MVDCGSASAVLVHFLQGQVSSAAPPTETKGEEESATGRNMKHIVLYEEVFPDFVLISLSKKSV